MSEKAENISTWMPPLVGNITKELIDSQAAHAREIKRKYLESEQRGYQAGIERAKKQVEQDNKEEKKALLTLIEKMAAPLSELNQMVIDELSNMIKVAVSKLTYHAYTVAPELLMQVIEAGIEALPAHSKEIILRLHPTDAARIRSLLSVKEGQSFKQLFVVDDHQLKPGDLIFKTKDSEIDASLSTRLDNILTAFGAGPQAHE